KKEKQKQYQRNLEIFESKATQLYELLKLKEEAELRFESTLADRAVLAMSFIQHQHYIEQLEEKVNALQPEVQEARNSLKKTQVQLSEAHVEVKKFEKLIDQKLATQNLLIKKEENKQMDELSMKQFINFKNR
ncbi:flagellar export protein FliJ, partial [Halobacillus sp. BBL2006]|uniref:flagellar export protein FliJ n=1 Tax=Halobacillus sp. BBL2006 TaxID=1543706 RepID=UPI0005435F3B